MPLAAITRRFGNELYRFAFPLYGPLYSTYKAYSDRAERRVLAETLAPGAVVADLGANIGIYTEFLSRCVGRAGAVHSFEPSPDNFRRLQRRLKRCSNVHLSRLAVSDKSGELSLYLSERLNVDHRAYPVSGEVRRPIVVQSITLDDYFAPQEYIDFLKIDIQGFELRALRGAERVLAENTNLKILLELWPYGLQQAGDSARQLLTFLSDRGFSFFQFVRGELKRFESEVEDTNNPEGFMNLFVKRVNKNAVVP